MFRNRFHQELFPFIEASKIPTNEIIIFAGPVMFGSTAPFPVNRSILESSPSLPSDMPYAEIMLMPHSPVSLSPVHVSVHGDAERAPERRLHYLNGIHCLFMFIDISRARIV